MPGTHRWSLAAFWAPRSVVKTNSKQITTHNWWDIDFKCAPCCQRKASDNAWMIAGRLRVRKSLYAPRALQGVLRVEQEDIGGAEGTLLSLLCSIQVSPLGGLVLVQTDPARNVPVLQASISCLQLGNLLNRSGVGTGVWGLWRPKNMAGLASYGTTVWIWPSPAYCWDDWSQATGSNLSLVLFRMVTSLHGASVYLIDEMGTLMATSLFLRIWWENEWAVIMFY